MASVTHTVTAAVNPPSQAITATLTSKPGSKGAAPGASLTIDDGTNQYIVTGPRSQIVALLVAAVNMASGLVESSV